MKHPLDTSSARSTARVPRFVALARRAGPHANTLLVLRRPRGAALAMLRGLAR